MSNDKENNTGFVPYQSAYLDRLRNNPTSSQQLSLLSSTSVRTKAPVEVTSINTIILNVHLKYNYPKLKEFANELTRVNRLMCVDNRSVSILHLYALKSTKDPIDMSNQNIRKIYRPNLFIRKNDAFGPWNFNFLLTILEIDYRCPNDGDFPEVWKTTDQTNVTVNIIPNSNMTTTQSNISDTDNKKYDTTDDSTTLYGVLIQICRQNNYDESEATLWLNKLKEESITTLDHLRTISSNDNWEKVTSIKQLPKQMIRDYMQLNTASNIINKVIDPYENSTATLIGDIHRVRRYFYYVTDNLKYLSYLDPDAVDLAIKEVRRAYDDDGNILLNIHSYLKTFCLKNAIQSETEHEKQRNEWREQIKELQEKIRTYRPKMEDARKECESAEDDIKYYSARLEKHCQREKELGDIVMSSGSITQNFEAQRQRNEFDNQKRTMQKDLDNKQSILRRKKEPYLHYAKLIDSAEKQIENFEGFLELDLTEEHKKLTVKFGRGLLLYGPPGTGKSELLKRVAVYAGITMVTQPLAAGELNRPYVGETEKLLIDIMYRSNTIPYLICAMTIDEIDGLVPKRDNNAQQSKVDGISVLLSHIEGVKNIPNLIVFGATNRRNMMDEAFLRRMQAKVFVGRPSPQIRKKMLQPLLIKDSQMFTSERIDFLVKITTNFSGAAVGALKSSIIVAMDNQSYLSDNQLLELADNAAREFSCWFGVGTLPEICRLHRNIFNSQNQNEYSLTLPKQSPTGRILVDLQNGKCLIELTNEPTLIKDLQPEETSILTLLGRFINGCSSRNIDTIQIIDLNFLTKQNAFDENQKFELLTTSFGECNEYNRSMLIFDIDSLIMLSISDSSMSKSLSISNIALYQFIREKCKTAVVEQNQKDQIVESNTLKEKWIVMIVKHPLLLNTLIEDIEFKKTSQQIQQEEDEAEQKLDDESARTCPKCLQNYIPSKTNYGNCRYHDGFVYDLDNDRRLTNDEAQCIMQKARLTNRSLDQQPKLIWACCLGLYGHDQPCQTDVCGLPSELKNQTNINLTKEDAISLVQQFFMKNKRAQQKIENFLANYKQSLRSTTTNISALKK